MKVDVKEESVALDVGGGGRMGSDLRGGGVERERRGGT